MVWYIITSISWKKNNTGPLGRIARSYELHARMEGEFFYYPNGICLRGTQRWFPPKYLENTFLGYPEYF